MLLGECPLWHPLEQVLYWIDIASLAVHSFDPSTLEHKVWHVPSEPGCIAWRKAGGLVVATRLGILILDTDSGMLAPLIGAPYDAKAFRFNDGRCDSAGRLWIGTLVDARDGPFGSLYCLNRGDIRAFDYPVVVSNGIAFSPDFSTMYHSDTTAHRINAYKFDIEKGKPDQSRPFKTFPTEKGSAYIGRPDGAAVDSEGAYWVAMYEGGRIVKISPEGEIASTLLVPMMRPTMLAFGGEDLRTLYVTGASQKCSPEELLEFPLSGHVLATQVDVAGLSEHGYVD